MKVVQKMLYVIGIILIFSPFLGFPIWIETALFLVLGSTLIYLGYKIRFLDKKIQFKIRQMEQLQTINNTEQVKDIKQYDE